MNLLNFKPLRFIPVAAGFDEKRHLVKSLARKRIKKYLIGVIDLNWNQKILKKYTLKRPFIPGLQFIFLRRLLNIIRKSSASPTIIYRLLDKIVAGKEVIEFGKDFSGTLYAKRTSSDIPIPRFNLIAPFLFLASFGRQSIFRNLMSNVVANFQKPMQPAFEVHWPPIDQRLPTLQNLKVHGSMFSRMVSIIKKDGNDFPKLYPKDSHSQVIKNINDKSGELRIKKPTAKTKRPLFRKNRLYPLERYLFSNRFGHGGAFQNFWLNFIASFQNLSPSKFPPDSPPIFSRHALIQNLIFNGRRLSRLLAIIKNGGVNYSGPPPMGSDFSAADNFIGQSAGLKVKKSHAAIQRSSYQKKITFKGPLSERFDLKLGHSIAAKFSNPDPKIGQIQYVNISGHIQDHLQRNIGPIVATQPVKEMMDRYLAANSKRASYAPFALENNENAWNHSAVSNLRYPSIEYNMDALSFSGYGFSEIDLIHSNPAIPAAISPADKTPLPFAPYREIGPEQPFVESKGIQEEIHKAVINSPVIAKIADRVSNILERRLFIERERRGF